MITHQHHASRGSGPWRITHSHKSQLTSPPRPRARHGPRRSADRRIPDTASHGGSRDRGTSAPGGPRATVGAGVMVMVIWLCLYARPYRSPVPPWSMHQSDLLSCVLYLSGLCGSFGLVLPAWILYSTRARPCLKTSAPGLTDCGNFLIPTQRRMLIRCALIARHQESPSRSHAISPCTMATWAMSSVQGGSFQLASSLAAGTAHRLSSCRPRSCRRRRRRRCCSARLWPHT